jgi:hypothetical protein
MNTTDAASSEPTPQIETFELDPLAIAEGEVSEWIITLSRPAPPDTSITLEGAPAIAEFPALLLVPTSETQVTFKAVATESFQGFQEMALTARCFSSTKEARLRIGGEVWLEAPRDPLVPIVVVGGVTLDGQHVTLVRPAPDSGIDIMLFSNLGHFARPSPNPVHVPPGSKTAPYKVLTEHVGDRVEDLITASDGIVAREILRVALDPEAHE